MAEKGTIQSLISTSGEEEWESLPLFYEGKIIKRISKEEIQGWTQGRPSQPFQKEQPRSRKTRRSIVLLKQPQPLESFERDSLSPPPSLRSIKNKLTHYDNNQNLFKAFRTIQEPSPQEVSLPKVKGSEQPKEDYVKGIKFANFCPLPKKTTPALKPLFRTSYPQENKVEKGGCRSMSQRGRNAFRKQSANEREVSVISYPIDVDLEEENSAPFQHKLQGYMRKYQINVFQP